MRTVCRLAVLGALLAVSASALGRDIYVSNTAGDDRFSGRQDYTGPEGGGPVRTIGRALALAVYGDHIVVENTGEPYRESITLMGSHHSGSKLRPLVLQGNGAVLDGSAPIPRWAWEHYRGPVFRFIPPLKQYQQLFLGGRPAERVIGDPWSDAPPEMEPFQWCLHQGAIYFRVEEGKLPEDYGLSYAAERVGLSILYVDHVVVQDLVVQGFQLDGLNAHNSARHVLLQGIKSRGNGRAGVTIGGACDVTLEASLVGDNGQAQLLTLPYGQTTITDSVLLGNTAPGWVDHGGQVTIDGKPTEGGLDELIPEPPAEEAGR